MMEMNKRMRRKACSYWFRCGMAALSPVAQWASCRTMQSHLILATSNMGAFGFEETSRWSHNSREEAYKGGSNSVSKNYISFRCKKRTPKTSLLYLLVLIMTTFPLLLCWCKRSRVSKACNRGASRLGEAWARPRLGRKTYWHMGTRNYNSIVEVPARLNLK